jgi:hypothetical protein
MRNELRSSPCDSRLMLHLICQLRIQVHHDNDDEPDINMATEITNEIQLVREKASKDKVYMCIYIHEYDYNLNSNQHPGRTYPSTTTMTTLGRQ